MNLNFNRAHLGRALALSSWVLGLDGNLSSHIRLSLGKCDMISSITVISDLKFKVHFFAKILNLLEYFRCC